HELDPGPQREAREPALQAEQREADAAGGAGTRGVPLASPGRRLEAVAPGCEAPIEPDDILGRGALLRPVGRRRATRPEQGVVHVARDPELDPSEPRIEVR